jgi:hypothetical protein
MSPNPVCNGNFNIILEKAMFSEVVIYNVNGQIVKSQLIDNLINTISVETLGRGVYFVEVKNTEGKTVKKIILE